MPLFDLEMDANDNINQRVSKNAIAPDVLAIPFSIDSENLFDGVTRVIKIVKPTWDVNYIKFKVINNNLVKISSFCVVSNLLLILIEGNGPLETI